MSVFRFTCCLSLSIYFFSVFLRYISPCVLFIVFIPIDQCITIYLSIPSLYIYIYKYTHTYLSIYFLSLIYASICLMYISLSHLCLIFVVFPIHMTHKNRLRSHCRPQWAYILKPMALFFFNFNLYLPPNIKLINMTSNKINFMSRMCLRKCQLRLTEACDCLHNKIHTRSGKPDRQPGAWSTLIDTLKPVTCIR